MQKRSGSKLLYINNERRASPPNAIEYAVEPGVDCTQVARGETYTFVGVRGNSELLATGFWIRVKPLIWELGVPFAVGCWALAASQRFWLVRPVVEFGAAVA